jgi:putative ABC transport system permease protein
MSSLRNAIRALRSNPLVSIVVILSLALGIGANAAMFSIVDALVLRDLPVRHAGRIAMVFDDVGGAGFWSHPIWESIRKREALFDDAFAYSGWKFNLSEAGEVDPADGLWASGSMFSTLGVDAVIGRTFSPDDDRSGGGPDGPVAVLSYEFWQRRFAGDRSIIGQPIKLNGVAFTVVGVTGPRFFGPEVGRTFDVAVPLNTEPLVRQQRSSLGSHGSWLQVVVRLKPGQTPGQATAALRAVQPRIAEETRPPNARPEDLARYLANPLTIRPGATVSGIRDQYDAPLLALMAIVGLTLLIACGNIANLLIARSLARRHEYSVRSALGASASRLGRQVLTESGLLAVTGAASGIVVAVVGSRLLAGQLSSTTNRVFNRVFLDVGLDWRVIAFTTTVAVLTTLIFGVGPALQSARVAPIDAMKEQGRALSGRQGGLASSLVAMQVALSLVLLIGAGLFVRTFMTLANTELGFRPAQVMVVELGTDRAGTDSAARREMYQRMIDGVASVPGVATAALSTVTPVSGSNSTRFMLFPGRPELAERERRVWTNGVSRGWFTALGMDLVSGRGFDERDHVGSGRVVVVNEAFARKYFAGVNPIGMTIVDQPSQFADPRPIEIIGIVRDAVYRSLREPVPPTMYWAIEQQVRPPAAVALMLRTDAGETAMLRQRVSEAVVRVNANVTTSMRALDDVVDAALSQERLVARLSACFSVLALLLAALGLYGITSYSVTRRHTELGIRLALGTAPRQVAGLVLSNVAKLVAVGLVAGLIVSWWASRFIRGMLFALEPGDVPTMVAATTVLVCVALLASWLPARRAARIDPAQILRDA